MNEKEVYFNQYCPTCEHWDKTEDLDPCDECLAQPVNENSHKPLYYKKAKRKSKSSNKTRCTQK